MKTLHLNLKKLVDESYDVVISRGLLNALPAHLSTLGVFENYVIITDSKVRRLYGGLLAKRLKARGLKVTLLSFFAGEKSKSQKTKTYLEERMLKNHCNRNTLVIALGGGVVGDMAGFVAATFMRGVPYVQVPTTILGMVDASLGGKTGIDTPQGKNLIGAFWQPKKVFVDLSLLSNLPLKQMLNGYYEIVKVGITSNRALFARAEKNLEGVKKGNLKALEHLIIEGLKIKAGIVQRDEREADDRMILNFGHTIGHALEHLSGYKILHGFGVALGIVAEAKISVMEGLLRHEDYDRIAALVRKTGIDVSLLKKWTPAQIIRAARKDKKTRGGKLKVVLIEGIGKLHRRDGLAASAIGDEVIIKALKSL